MSAKKKSTEETSKSHPVTSLETVTVEVIKQPLYEGDAYRAKGDRFELPAARAAVLCNLVKIVSQ